MAADLPSTYNSPIHLAIIGGTGLSTLSVLKPLAILPKTHPNLQTPWGAPSSPITILSYPGPSHEQQPLTIAFLARHGLHHELSPSEVNSRANLAALRKLGVRCVVAFSAVGSLREEVKPRDFLVPDQVIDRTKGVRPWTFFEQGIVGHVGFADPFDDELREVIVEAVHGKGVLQGSDVKIHPSGSLVCMEGPQFSTRAESHLYRSWNADAINMSCLPEAKLAREAELSYAMICMSTDYDAWHSVHEAVTVEIVMGNMRANAENAGRVVEALLAALAQHKYEIEEGLAVPDVDADEEGMGKVARVLSGKKWRGMSKGGVSTARDGWGEQAREKLDWLFPGEYR
ncbi:S-methyl-5-thioadenosine phosphorylase [Agyrium rufum]|nr:S-methyl-5-thioadenosine phosphorylase [Agyrium rufum]